MVSDLPSRLRQSWHANADAWTHAVREGTIPSRESGTDAAIVEAVVRSLPPAGRVLDVGCGEGWLCRALAALGAETHGVDASEPLVSAARDAGGSYDVLSFDDAGLDPSRLGGPYEAAVFNFALLDDAPGGILRAVRRALSPGGRVYIQTVHPATVGGPYRDGWREETFTSFGGSFEPMPWYFRTFGSWVRVLTGAGFAVIDVIEPLAPAGDAPLSLLLVAEAPLDAF
ncbi:MAG: class I SAM-dependent methyltransferase [Bacteroidota bacterium]